MTLTKTNHGSNCCIQAFTSNSILRPRRHLFASTEKKQEGAPQYEKIVAKLVNVEPVAKGAVLLHIEAGENDEWDYDPGHVLALEIQGEPKDKTTHTYEDTQKNNGWMRGPYTVTASPSNKELQVLLKLVGEKSQAFADAEPGTAIQVGGKFKVPIVEGIDADSTDQVIFLSTGVGVGPCVGAMEMVLDEVKASSSFPPIHLVASFRTQEEVCLADKLNQLQTDSPEQFSWTPIITSSPNGRVSSSVAGLQEALQVRNDGWGFDLSKTHFHLIGNGQLVYEFQKGLEAAGVPKEKVTLEIYFNHKSKPNQVVVERIAKAIQGMTILTEEDAATTTTMAAVST